MGNGSICLRVSLINNDIQIYVNPVTPSVADEVNEWVCNNDGHLLYLI